MPRGLAPRIIYLSVPAPLKINPPMGNVTLRNLLAKMTQVFKDWADAYFYIDEETKEGDNANVLIAKEDALAEFAKATNQKNWTTNKFTSSLRAFCRFYGYKYNPKSFTNSQGRISRKVDGTTKDMIYIQTQLTVNPEDLHDGNTDDTNGDEPF